MTKTCTSTLNNVVRYLYNETSDSENELIEFQISKDSAILDFYLDCISLKTEMNDIRLSPSKNIVSNIMMYSENFKPTI